jgi:hypothetical protein
MICSTWSCKSSCNFCLCFANLDRPARTGATLTKRRVRLYERANRTSNPSRHITADKASTKHDDVERLSTYTLTAMSVVLMHIFDRAAIDA